ncbi:hypothetical protein TNCV_2120591 [Trichonephila clavipes]|nr:hypothetical protein TNCV_2120591 [Trichonephila clavipes]
MKKPVQRRDKWRGNRTVRQGKEVEETSKKRILMALIQKSQIPQEMLTRKGKISKAKSYACEEAHATPGHAAIRPVSIETESLKYNDMGLLRGPVNEENKYPSDPLINIH